MKFEDFTAVSLKIAEFCGVTPYSLVDMYH
jgi:hypothetical protein